MIESGVTFSETAEVAETHSLVQQELLRPSRGR